MRHAIPARGPARPDRAAAASPPARTSPHPARARPEHRSRAHNPRFSALALQTKLKVGAIDDPLEREADRVADIVMRDDDATVRRMCSACAEEQATIRRQPVEDEEPDELVQRDAAAGPAGGALTPGLARQVEATRRGGEPLAPDVRAIFEPRLGRDHREVRIHRDATAADAASALAARAYTVGADIAFAPGQYQPGTPAGRRLLAHELAHVAQQSGASGLTLRCQPAPATTTYLRNLTIPPAGVAALAPDAIRATAEFKAFMDPRLIWQWQDKVKDDEALRACLLIIEDLQAGIGVRWPGDARKYLERVRGATTVTAPGTVAPLLGPRVHTTIAEFPDPELCYVPGSKGKPNYAQVDALIGGRLEIPADCSGSVRLVTTVSDPPGAEGRASGWFDVVRFGISDGSHTGVPILGTGQSETTLELAQEFPLDPAFCDLNREVYHYVKFPGTGQYTFAEIKYAPRIRGRSTMAGPALSDASTAPVVRVEPCDHLVPSGARGP